jgi:integration host factor subunit beta
VKAVHHVVFPLWASLKKSIRGLCSFFVKTYNSYTGRNPKTGEKVMVKPKRLPFFKAGKEIKEREDL